MTSFIIRRLGQTVIVLFFISILVFSLLKIVPGDPVLAMLGPSAPKEQVEALRLKLGLDRPLIEQYLTWLGNLLRGDFGMSVVYQTAVVDLLKARLPVTLYIGVQGFILANLVGIVIGIICAVRWGKAIDSALTTFSIILLGIPHFFLAILGVFVFGVTLRWLPIQGYTSPFDDFWLSLRQVILPVACLAAEPIAGIARQTRSAMLEVIHQDYVRTAWAKGLTEGRIILKHALKNALIPVVTLSGIKLGMIVGGTVFIESVFNIPGMGRLLVSSIMSKDFVVAQAIILLTGVTIAIVNLLVEILYSWLDPRIRYS